MILSILFLLMTLSFFEYIISFALLALFEKEIYDKLFKISTFTTIFFSFAFIISLIITFAF